MPLENGHGAKPGDMYEKDGERFVVTARWNEPVVMIESIDRPGPQMMGGISGAMWDGFKPTEPTGRDVTSLLCRLKEALVEAVKP